MTYKSTKVQKQADELYKKVIENPNHEQERQEFLRQAHLEIKEELIAVAESEIPTTEDRKFYFPPTLPREYHC